MSLTLRLALLFVFAVAAALLTLLATASSSSSTFDRFYPWLIAANTAVAGLMAGLTAWVVFRAWHRFKNKVFGARLMVRLAFAFALIGAVPVVLVSLVSAQFLAKTIDSWFSQSVDVALESGLSLGRASLDTIQNDVMARTRRLALLIEDAPPSAMTGIIEKAIDSREGVDILVMSGSGAVLASRSVDLANLVPDLPPAEAMGRARAARQYISVEPKKGASDGQMQVRAIAQTSRMTPTGDEIRFVQWVEQIPVGLSRNLEALNEGVRDYQQLVLGKDGLQKIYGVTLLLTLLLAFFAALISAVLLSGWLAGPLRQLERATKAVASGDYRPLRSDPKSTDELNLLVQSFNQMTAQLNDARKIAGESRLALEASNRFLEQVLANLSAGVLIFDPDWRLLQSNRGAEKILGQALSGYQHQPIQDIKLLTDCVAQLQSGLQKKSETQFQHETLRPDGQQLTLLMSASQLPGPQPGYVLIFDDIGDVLSAQRSKAFADMARRLAHEIKNPLTPIQLSAERLERRLAEKLRAEDADLLHRSTHTIVEQVAALKAMVDEFRNYARLPAANLQLLDLDQLLSEMLLLYATDPRIQWTPSGRPHLVMADRAQVIQVVHNLVQNAQDAVAETPGAMIELRLEEDQNADHGPLIRLTVLDNGPGLSPQAKSRLFEPYFTSKAKGSGLGLAIVKKIAEENHARVSLQNRQDSTSGEILGAKAYIEFAKVVDASHNQTVNVKGLQA